MLVVRLPGACSTTGCGGIVTSVPVAVTVLCVESMVNTIALAVVVEAIAPVMKEIDTTSCLKRRLALLDFMSCTPSRDFGRMRSGKNGTWADTVRRTPRRLEKQTGNHREENAQSCDCSSPLTRLSERSLACSKRQALGPKCYKQRHPESDGIVFGRSIQISCTPAVGQGFAPQKTMGRSWIRLAVRPALLIKR